MVNNNLKALYIVVSAGFSERVVEYIRSVGATGATIINARGVSSMQKEIMGISVDREKEIVLTLTDNETAEKIMEAVKQNEAFKAEAHGVCFTLPVIKTIGIRQNPVESKETNK